MLRPAGFTLPALDDLETELPGAIAEAKGLLADPPVTVTQYIPPKKKAKQDHEAEDE